MSSLSSHEEASGGDEFVGQIPSKKGQWTSEEDAILTEYVKKHGEGNWNAVQKKSELARSGKSCRLRWINHLRPDLKKGPFTLDEERKIIELHAQIGNKWSLMAAELPGRTDNEIKNYWNTRKKKMERAGLPLYPDDISPSVLLDGNQENSNVSTSQHADVLQEDNPDIPDVKFRNYKLSQEYSSYSTPTISDTTESSMFEQGSDSSLYRMIRPLRQVWYSDVLYNSLYSTCISSSAAPALIGDNLCGRYTGLSGNTSIYGAMKPELPSLPCIETQQGSRWDTPACPLPSFDESVDTLIQSLPAEQTHQLESVSQRSSGLLESIFYPPKILEGSNNDSLHPCKTEWDEQGEPNSTKKEDLNRRDLTNQDALPDLGWSGNDNVYNKDQSDSDPIKDTLFAIFGKDFHGYH